MKKLLLLALLISQVLIVGCTTVTRGTKDVLVVESEPPGANVRLSNGMTGTTPTSFELPRKKNVVVTISKEGYETLNVNVTPKVVGAGAAGMAGNVLIGGLVGAAIDVGTGAMNDLYPNPIQVNLVETGDAREGIITASQPQQTEPTEPVQSGDVVLSLEYPEEASAVQPIPVDPKLINQSSLKESNLIFVHGEVIKPGFVKRPDAGMTLIEALTECEGLRYKTECPVQVQRLREDASVEAIDLKTSDSADMLFALESGDMVKVLGASI